MPPRHASAAAEAEAEAGSWSRRSCCCCCGLGVGMCTSQLWVKIHTGVGRPSNTWRPSLAQFYEFLAHCKMRDVCAAAQGRAQQLELWILWPIANETCLVLSHLLTTPWGRFACLPARPTPSQLPASHSSRATRSNNGRLQMLAELPLSCSPASQIALSSCSKQPHKKIILCMCVRVLIYKSVARYELGDWQGVAWSVKGQQLNSLRAAIRMRMLHWIGMCVRSRG